MISCQGLFIGLAVAGLALGDAPPPQPYPLAEVHSAQGNSASPYPAAPAAAPAVPSYTKWPEDDQTIHLQSGYEGYLVPSEPPLSFGDILRTAGLVAIAPPLGKIGLKFAFKFGIWFLGFAALFLIGSFVTTAVCTLTPLCTISFLGLGPFSKETARSFISEDRLNAATQFVHDAIAKYRALNKKNDGESKTRR